MSPQLSICKWKGKLGGKLYAGTMVMVIFMIDVEGGRHW